MHNFQMTLDEDDLRSVNEAIARRQNLRVHGECILPDGESDLRGSIVAEICRGWLELMQRNPSNRKDNA